MDTQERIKLLTKKLKSIYFSFLLYRDLSDDQIKTLFDLFINNQIFDPINENDKYANTEINYLAIYYEHVLKDFHKAKIYFILAIEKGNKDAMNNLALLYDEYLQNFGEAEKYYRMSIDNGLPANRNIANFYYEYKNYMYAERYYLIAIQKGEIFAISNLANFYNRIVFKYLDAEKYYLMAIEIYNDVIEKHIISDGYEVYRKKFLFYDKYYFKFIKNLRNDAIKNLIQLYSDLHHQIKLLRLYINNQWCTLFTRQDIINLMNNINKRPENNVISNFSDFIDIIIQYEFQDSDLLILSPTLKIIINLIKRSLTIMKLHFEYSLESNGFIRAKQDFYNRLT